MFYIVSMELISKSTHHHLYKQKNPTSAGLDYYFNSTIFFVCTKSPAWIWYKYTPALTGFP